MVPISIGSLGTGLKTDRRHFGDSQFIGQILEDLIGADLSLKQVPTASPKVKTTTPSPDFMWQDEG